MAGIAGVAAFALHRTGGKTPAIIGYTVLAAASARCVRIRRRTPPSPKH